MIIGRQTFETTNHTYIMGILNVTPDSFSDGGEHNTVEKAIAHVQRMIEEGASIIDVGGESTRPGYTKIGEAEEIYRVVPVIEAIKRRFDIPVSIDTYKSQVAAAALQAGANLVNDIWGLQYDDKMARVIADADAACCLMHNRTNTDYQDFMEDVKADLAKSVEIAVAAGINREKIILDPGVGFAKNVDQNLEVIARLHELKELGCPILLGTSRKSVIGKTLNLPTNERLEGTLATGIYGVMEDAMFLRVHDVKEHVRAVKMVRAIMNHRG
ncbi:dihydropteroate synthase [Eubacterium oxidoreducens]|uniref:Dihydropteroate synthase n=1 Tax=Eubacterium oxidoreducens TaxID=1732 RepID=A0A1G6C4A9_EUBOX|nr:dihydropteroate synthase [Eubacterium oxidoreducens]SDB27725.1 Dihydropteroate synthase [Eubacterium oxidoreducens]